MKMNPAQFARLESEILETLRQAGPEIIEQYEYGRFPRSDAVKDLNKRFRWDLYHFTSQRIHADTGNWLHDEYYRYLDDSHIDTALRRILPTITRKY